MIIKETMTTPPKDKPVFKDEEIPAEQDDLSSDEAVAAPDLPIAPEKEETNKESDQEEASSADLNVNNNDVGLNNEQGEEFL
jgi:outer membrane biosynthesis protein TonB